MLHSSCLSRNFAVFTFLSSFVLSQTATANEEQPKTIVTISEETTVLTEPLTEDGYVDYLAALNALASEGVTPENNAAVLLRRSLGLMDMNSEHDRPYRDNYDKMLGIEPAGPGVYVPLSTVAEEQAIDEEQAYNHQTAAQRRPWTAKEFPVIADWLERNEAAMDMIVEATRRPRFYMPYAGYSPEERPPLIGVLTPALQDFRIAGEALAVRAARHAGDGCVEAALTDLEACHRLARLVGQDPMTITGLVAILISRNACHGDLVLLSTHEATPQQLTAYLDRLANLPRPLDMATRIDRYERWTFAEAVIDVARGKANTGSFTGASGVRLPNLPRFLLQAVNWDNVLRDGNQWYDRMHAAMTRATYAEQQQAFSAIDRELQQWYERVKQGDVNADALSDLLVLVFMPSSNMAVQAEHRAEMRFDMTRVAIALEIYRLRNGEFPNTLGELEGDILPEIPQDRFAGESLSYERRDEGYLLYSVGVNGSDDDATSAHDNIADGEHAPGGSVSREAGDDIVIRMPLPKP